VREQPLLLIIEDRHWIDGDQAVLDSLVEREPAARLMLVVNHVMRSNICPEISPKPGI